MTEKEISRILISTSKGDWIENDEERTWTYKDDVLLRMKWTIDRSERFCEEWATNPYADHVAYKAIYDIYYGNSWITTKTLVAVDGMREILPMPESGTLKIPREEYLFAKIVSSDSLDKYMDRSGLTLVKPENGDQIEE